MKGRMKDMKDINVMKIMKFMKFDLGSRSAGHAHCLCGAVGMVLRELCLLMECSDTWGK